MPKETQQEESVTPHKKKYFEFRIPKLTFQNTPINGFLVFTVVIFAFLLGMLTNKIIYLEQATKAANAQPTGGTGSAEAEIPTPPPVVKDMKVGKLPTLGNKDAKVTIVEFSDFQCPFCKKYFDDTQAQLKKDYIDTGKIQFSYRHYPLSSIHPLAQKAGEASECANEQGKFWEYHDVLFQQQDSWSPTDPSAAVDKFVELAGPVGLDTAQFKACLEEEKYKKNVTDDAAVGDSAQVDGTPTFFINGTRLVGALPYSEIKKAIDKALNE
jgi:protein-disulfide isomerase